MWGEGVYLINSEGDCFMVNYVFSCMELVFCDIIFCVIILEICVGWGINMNGSVGGLFIYFDLWYMGWEKIMSWVFFCWEEGYCFLGIDVVNELMLVCLIVYYFMGGIFINIDGRVFVSVDILVDGLFVVGECVCVLVYGVNCLGSNFLLECVVYGWWIGAVIVEFVEGWKLFDVEE